MNTYNFFIRKGFSIEDAWEELESLGSQPLYGEDYGEIKQVVADLQDIPFEDFPFTDLETIGAFSPILLPETDWSQQWALHGADYHEGYVHVHINSETCPTLKLEPGPGFGDLSHPTTRLVLDMMETHVRDQFVVDVGTGSGILALAAKALGAREVWGFDIDPEAIEHSKKNLALNPLEGQIHFSVKPPLASLQKKQELVLLMNMILAEQKVAWEEIVLLHAIPGYILTSGVLLEQREEYLEQASKWGWKLLEEKESEGWLAFYFSR